jgi:hypothetical protein
MPGELDGGEVPDWTGAVTCGNCHARDSLELRLAGSLLFAGASGPGAPTKGQLSYRDSTSGKLAESRYAGSALVAGANCKTCHALAPGDDSETGGSFILGTTPLRVPSAANDQVLLEKSSAPGVFDGTPAGAFGSGNVCVWCHKSRRDLTNYLTATNNSVTDIYWGPHGAPDADVYSAKGGYHYAGKVYGGGSGHQLLDGGCVSCHMHAAPSNQDLPDHSFAVALEACASCHQGFSDFNIGGAQSQTAIELQQLRSALNDLGLLTRDVTAPFSALSVADLALEDFEQDLPRPGATGLSSDRAGALYNYLLLARGSALGIHNPPYVVQLLYDSVESLTGSPPAWARPPGRP